MKKLLQQLQLTIDALTLRERGLIFLSGIAVFFVLWNFLMFAPQHEKRQALNSQMQSMQQRLDAQTQEVAILASLLDTGVEAEKIRQLKNLKRENEELNDTLSDLAVDLVPPGEMLNVLRAVLKQSSKLTIRRIESLPAEDLKLNRVNQSGGEHIPGVFRHTVVLSLKGSYFALLEYLKGLEQLPWRFYWASLSFRVSDYPLGNIELRVSTLSMEETLLDN